MDEQQFGMNNCQILGGGLQISWLKGCLRLKDSRFESIHVFCNTRSRWPGKSTLGHFNGSVSACPFINATQPIPVHLTDEFRRKDRFVCHYVQISILRILQCVVLGLIHFLNSPDTEFVSEDFPAGARLKFTFDSRMGSILRWTGFPHGHMIFFQILT